MRIVDICTKVVDPEHSSTLLRRSLYLVIRLWSLYRSFLSLNQIDDFSTVFFFSSRRRHTRSDRDWSSECALPICSASDTPSMICEYASTLCSRAPMNGSTPQNIDGVSDAERSLLRRSVRDFLANIWPADKAAENSEHAEAIAKLCPAMAQQGLSSLGSNAAGVGVREIILVFEELGRASAPAPPLGAVGANLV